MHPMSSARAAGTISAWSVASWIFFGLAVLSSLLFVAYWQLYRSAPSDPLAGTLLGITMLTMMGVTWEAAWASSSIGTVLGLLGVLREEHRTRAGWAALALNGGVALVTTVLMFILG